MPMIRLQATAYDSIAYDSTAYDLSILLRVPPLLECEIPELSQYACKPISGILSDVISRHIMLTSPMKTAHIQLFIHN